MSKGTIYALLSLVWAIIMTTHCLADNVDLQQNNINSYLNQWRQDNQVPAVVVSISRAGQAPQTYLSGYTDLAQKKAVHADSLFAIGAVSKTFVSAMILRLVAEKQLNLNDPIDKWLPQYPHWHNVSVGQLLDMTSGIFRFTEDDGFKQMRLTNPQQAWRPKQLIDIAYQHPNYFQPGTHWQDSNTNYLILGLIIEKIAQQPLAWILDRNFIRPLGLMHTYYISMAIPPAILPLMAQGYQQDKDVTEHDFSVYAASGCMLSTTEDMVVWARALFTQVLPPQQLTQLMVVNSPQLTSSTFALGFFSLPTASLGTIWWSVGVVEGYSAVLIWIPSQQTAIAATINRLTKDNYMLLFPQQALFQYLLSYQQPSSPEH